MVWFFDRKRKAARATAVRGTAQPPQAPSTSLNLDAQAAAAAAYSRGRVRNGDDNPWAWSPTKDRNPQRPIVSRRPFTSKAQGARPLAAGTPSAASPAPVATPRYTGPAAVQGGRSQQPQPRQQGSATSHTTVRSAGTSLPARPLSASVLVSALQSPVSHRVATPLGPLPAQCSKQHPVLSHSKDQEEMLLQTKAPYTRKTVTSSTSSSISIGATAGPGPGGRSSARSSIEGAPLQPGAGNSQYYQLHGYVSNTHN